LVAASWKVRTITAGVALLVGLAGAAYGSATASSAATPKVPASANSDRTGITKTSVRVGNIATLNLGGLFKGALVGTQAYAAYINSKGGVNGRKIVVDSGADQFNNGAMNKSLTRSAIQSDFALVGGFTLNDSFGGTILAQQPGVPDVSVVLDPATNKLPNVFSPVPLNAGWDTGPLLYFKSKFPKDIKAVGTLVASSASAQVDWNGEAAALQHVGYKVIYAPQYPITTTDFTPQVIAMKNAGVKMLFLDQMPEQYASGLVKALNQQNFHPVVIFGAATYNSTLVSASGGAASVEGDYLQQNASLYLGGDSATIPSVATFLHWVNVVSPGFKPDLFTMYGWVSTQLFSQGLKAAGSNPSRGSLLKALAKVTSFNANNLIATTNPAAKTNGPCYIVAQIHNGQFQRIDDPPTTSSTAGYRCDGKYYTSSKS
jgi:branched-chain amino acid transport system substrate-binding protein